jgi:hypothetical protein
LDDRPDGDAKFTAVTGTFDVSSDDLGNEATLVGAHSGECLDYARTGLCDRDATADV